MLQPTIARVSRTSPVLQGLISKWCIVGAVVVLFAIRVVAADPADPVGGGAEVVVLIDAPRLTLLAISCGEYLCRLETRK